MELPGDPRTLLGDRQACLLFSLALGSLGSFLRLVGLPELVAEAKSDRPGHTEGDEAPDGVFQALSGIVVLDDDDDAEHDREARHRLRPLLEHPEQDSGGEGSEEHDDVLRGEPRVDEAGRSQKHHAHGRRPERIPPSREQRDEENDGRRQVEPEGTLGPVLLALIDGDHNRDASAEYDREVEPVELHEPPDRAHALTAETHPIGSLARSR